MGSLEAQQCSKALNHLSNPAIINSLYQYIVTVMFSRKIGIHSFVFSFIHSFIVLGSNPWLYTTRIHSHHRSTALAWVYLGHKDVRIFKYFYRAVLMQWVKNSLSSPACFSWPWPPRLASRYFSSSNVFSVAVVMQFDSWSPYISHCLHGF